MKKYTLQSILFTGLLFFNLARANYVQHEFIEFARNEVFIPERLGNIKLYKDYDGFHIFKDGETYDIQNCFCDPLLRKMSDDQLVNFLGRNKPKIIILTPEEFSQINPSDFVELTESEEDYLISQLFSSGYISVNQMNDGEYIIHAKIRLLGGVVSAEGAAATVAGVGIGGAAAAGGGISAATVFAGSAGQAAVAVWSGGAILGETGSGIALSLGAGAHTFAAIGGAAAAASAVVVPVAIAAGVVYIGVKGIQWLIRSPEEPVANPPANSPAAVVAPEEDVAPQATPAVELHSIPISRL